MSRTATRITNNARESPWRCRVLRFWLALGVLWAAGPATATAANDDAFGMGDVLPEFSGLPCTDERDVGSAEFGEARAVIIAFTCNRCPYAVDYEDRLNTLQRRYGSSPEQVRLLVINSNAGRDESLERMAQRAKKKPFSFRYAKDTDQSVARALGAVYTPEFFVFDQERRLVYKGALDDATNADEAKINFVVDAVDAILSGQPVRTTQTGARGCTIRFKRRRR